MKDTPFNNLLRILLPVITNVKYFFSKKFITENYYKHFCCTLVILYGLSWFMFLLMDLKNVPLWFSIFLGYLIGYGINFSREWYLAKFKNAPFSYEDIIFGGYGGITGLLIYYFIFIA